MTSDAKPTTVRKRKTTLSRVNDSDSSEAEFQPRTKRVGAVISLREKRSRGMLFFKTRVFK